MSGITKYGFAWGPLEVRRLATYRGSHAIDVKAAKNTVEIVVSPTGRSVRVFKNGRELK